MGNVTFQDNAKLRSLSIVTWMKYCNLYNVVSFQKRYTTTPKILRLILKKYMFKIGLCCQLENHGHLCLFLACRAVLILRKKRKIQFQKNSEKG